MEVVEKIAQQQDNVRNCADLACVTIAGLTIADLIPIVLGVPAFIIACLRIYDWFKCKTKNKGPD